jgi:hypothetical protein
MLPIGSGGSVLARILIDDSNRLEACVWRPTGFKRADARNIRLPIVGAALGLATGRALGAPVLEDLLFDQIGPRVVAQAWNRERRPLSQQSSGRRTRAAEGSLQA